MVGTGAKFWTFSRIIGRKVSALGVIDDEKGTKSPGTVRVNL